MELKGTQLLSAPKETVWDALMDPQVLAMALPGSNKLDRVGEHDYRAAMNVRVGPVQGKFDTKVELCDVKPQDSYRLKVDGQGAPGFVQGEGAILLEEDGDQTILRYDGEVQVGGRIAGVGQRLLDSTAKSLIRQGFSALDEQLQLRMNPPGSDLSQPDTDGQASAETPPGSTGEPSRSAPATDAQGPSTARIAADVARDVVQDLASDYVSPDQQTKILYAALGALLMLAFVVLVRLVQR